ncbi:hypothetical protein LP420_06065 [Massilia sp. B-10]|nr:hypothetical protein LP420_06065 [Massilia sp. B-10]
MKRLDAEQLLFRFLALYSEALRVLIELDELLRLALEGAPVGKRHRPRPVDAERQVGFHALERFVARPRAVGLALAARVLR